jgi:hypothetical protein
MHRVNPELMSCLSVLEKTFADKKMADCGAGHFRLIGTAVRACHNKLRFNSRYEPHGIHENGICNQAYVLSLGEPDSIHFSFPDVVSHADYNNTSETLFKNWIADGGSQ